MTFWFGSSLFGKPPPLVTSLSVPTEVMAGASYLECVFVMPTSVGHQASPRNTLRCNVPAMNGADGALAGPRDGPAPRCATRWSVLSDAWAVLTNGHPTSAPTIDLVDVSGLLDRPGSRRDIAVVIVLDPDDDIGPVVAALSEPVIRGLVTTSDPLDELRECLEHVSAGRLHATPTAVARLLDLVRRPGTDRLDRPELTARESEVLAAIVEGLSVKATARQLGVGLKTIEAHRRTLFQKLGVRSAVEALARADLLDRRGPSVG